MQFVRAVVALLVASFLLIPQIADAKKIPTLQADFDRAPVREVLQHIARVGRTNIVISDNVKGTVTLRLGKTRWDHAMLTVLRAKGLGMEKSGNVIWIDTLEGFRKSRESTKRVRELGEHVTPMAILLLPLSYAKAQDMAPIIQHYLSEDGTVAVDERTNTLIIEDHEDRLDKIQDLAREVIF